MAVWLLIFASIIPLAAGGVLAVLGRRMGSPFAGYAGTGASLLTLATAVAALVAWLQRTADVGGEVMPFVARVPWLPIWPGVSQATPGFLDACIYVDSVTVLLAATVALVAAVVNVFSLGYVKSDARYGRYFALLQWFVCAMLGLLMAGSLLQVLIFWELVGLCSYLLIAFDHHKQTAPRAAIKAFVMNRIGDVGFLIALGVLVATLGNVTLTDLWTLLGAAGSGGDVALPGGGVMSQLTLTVVGVGLFLGAVGKSAQFPLHTWLPDAMAGPTPVSALIHAATMVAAGVYLLARVFPILTPDAKLLVMIVGATTLTIGGLCALAQRDLKRVLAYSTVSQLGYMVLAIGAGSWTGALFHLVTHAFFKALLFLSAGSVLNAMRHETRFDKFGGLFVKLPVTATMFGVGVLAISAAPFLSGFYSKERILADVAAVTFLAEYARAAWAWQLLFWLPAVIAFVTPFYMARAWMLTFAGRSRDVTLFARAREPGIISFPLVFLAGMTVVGGYSWFPVQSMINNALAEQAAFLTEAGAPGGFSRVWPEPPRRSEDEFGLSEENDAPEPSAAAALVARGAEKAHAVTGWAWLIGLGLGSIVYARGYAAAALLMRIAPVRWTRDALIEGFYLDALYTHVIQGAALGIASAARWADKALLDPVVDLTAAAGRGAGRFVKRFDDAVLDGAVRGSANSVGSAGDLARLSQAGRVRGYAAVVLAFAATGVAAAVAIYILGGR